MLVFKLNMIPLPIKINKSLFCPHYACYFQGKINTVAKRGSMLKELIENKDKRKNWHLEIISTKAKVRVFEKIHKPHRRRAVLNSLFISNITDVISTGDIAPDLIQHGIEITGVSVSQCMNILNVFWQIPATNSNSSDAIGRMLAIAAPKIRAELISRNVLGRVPHIFFLRDATNERIAQYEEAVKKIETDLKGDTGIVADDSFTKDLFTFKDSKKPKVVEETICSLPVENETEKEASATPYKPTDMKSETCGLDHALLMNKVIALKKKKKGPPQHTNVISPESLESLDDLFSKIPGICFQAGTSNDEESRDAILKKFRIERKMLKEKTKDEFSDQYYHVVEEVDEKEFDSPEESGDFIDDEITDNTN